MRFERDLPIGIKLGVTVVGALAMLGALAWLGLTTIDRLDELRGQETGATRSERQVKDALIATQELRVVSQELPQQQMLGALKGVAERAAGDVGRAHDALEQARQSVPDPVVRRDLEAALGGLDAFAAALTQEAELRKTVLATRQKRLFQMRPVYDQSLQSLRDDLARGQGARTGVDAVRGGATTEAVVSATLTQAREEFTGYALAMDRLQNGALAFLATGNSMAANEVKDAASKAEARMAALVGSLTDDGIKSDASTVNLLGKGVAQAAIELIDQTRQLGVLANDQNCRRQQDHGRWHRRRRPGADGAGRDHACGGHGRCRCGATADPAVRRRHRGPADTVRWLRDLADREPDPWSDPGDAASGRG